MLSLLGLYHHHILFMLSKTKQGLVTVTPTGVHYFAYLYLSHYLRIAHGVVLVVIQKSPFKIVRAYGSGPYSVNKQLTLVGLSTKLKNYVLILCCIVS